MKLSLRPLILFALLVYEPLNSLALAADLNSANDAWVPLFNGKNLQGWTAKSSAQPIDEHTRSNFRVENGLLKAGKRQNLKSTEQFDPLFYNQSLSHYALHIEYRFAQQASNNTSQQGEILLHTQAPNTMQIKQKIPSALEIQLPQPSQRSQWTNLTIVILGGGRISYYIDGEKALDQPQPRRTHAISQAEQAGNLAKLQQGYIALQSTSRPIDFKQIRLINLAGCTNPNAKNYQPYFIRSDNANCLF